MAAEELRKRIKRKDPRLGVRMRSSDEIEKEKRGERT